MKEAKAKQLEQQIKKLAAQNAEFKHQLEESHKLMQGSLLVFKDLDAQVKTLKEFMIENKLMTEDKYEETVDEKRGLRLLSKADHIAVGDIAWVDYVAMVDGKEVARDQNVPIRVGSGAVNFELALVGHLVGETVQHDHVITEDGEFKDKTVNFAVDIRKAKTKIEDPDGATDEAEDQSDAEAGGSRLEEHHVGAPGDLRGEPDAAGAQSLDGSAPVAGESGPH